MKLFKRRKKVHNEDWGAWNFRDENDQYGLITYDLTYLKQDVSFHCKNEISIDLLFPDKYTSEGNFVSPDGHYHLIELEDHLISLLEKSRVDCIQVIRLTYDGARTFVFEVQDLIKFLETLKIWTSTIQEFEIRVEKNTAWTYYKKWKPTDFNWQQMGNMQVIEKLIESGSNPDKLHQIEVSIGGETNDLTALKDKLIEDGGKVLSLEKDLLEVEFESELHSEDIDELTYFLMELSKEFNCKYEGWRTAIVK